MIAFVNFLKIAAGCKFAYFTARCKLAFSIKKLMAESHPMGEVLLQLKKPGWYYPKKLKLKLQQFHPLLQF
jgi:hypothetical protein